MKRLFLLFIIFSFIVSAFVACTPDMPVDGRQARSQPLDSNPVHSSGSGFFSENERPSSNPGDILSVRVQRPAVLFEGKKVSENIRFEIKMDMDPRDYNSVITQIEKLLWFLPRGYIETAKATEDNALLELPVALDIEASRFQEEDFDSFGISYDTKTQSDFTWIKLFYIPDNHVKMNVPSHGDILLYVNPENTSDAIYAVQDYDDPDQWHITILHNWGQWLAREIDLFIYSTIA